MATSSALEIVTKLCSPDFARKAKAADFYSRAWDVIISANSTHDKILSSILAFFTALLASDPGSLAELAQRSDDDEESNDFVGTLVGLLGDSGSGSGAGIGERSKDVLGLVAAGVGDAETRKAGVGRTEKMLVSYSSLFLT